MKVFKLTFWNEMSLLEASFYLRSLWLFNEKSDIVNDFISFHSPVAIDSEWAETEWKVTLNLAAFDWVQLGWVRLISRCNGLQIDWLDGCYDGGYAEKERIYRSWINGLSPCCVPRRWVVGTFWLATGQWSIET